MDLIQKTLNGLPVMTAPNISAVHAFTTRYGGVSEGIYSSLNLGENRGDKKDDVCKNYNILTRALSLPAGGLAYSRQVHGTYVRKVAVFDKRLPYEKVPCDSDGLVTDERNLPLIIFTADCIPILLFDPVRGAIGAVHAGWRGTVADIAGEAVRVMAREYSCNPEDIQAAIGPGIGKCCFETGPEVAEAVLEIDGIDGGTFIEPRGEKFMVDLKEINHALLVRSGLLDKNIAVSSECTMCFHEKYWSHRHTLGIRGSQGAVIMLKG
ncbi:MAG: peptidoglycan editing factor PgeF [Oscillospiraceae bacterium]